MLSLNLTLTGTALKLEDHTGTRKSGTVTVQNPTGNSVVSIGGPSVQAYQLAAATEKTFEGKDLLFGSFYINGTNGNVVAILIT